jgi:RNA polymerase sigma-70 factor (ECF subfamily)
VETQDQPEPRPSPGTLGSVLYSGDGRQLVFEAEWVDLVRSVAAREQPALHALYERAHRPVFTLAVRITGCCETAEEVTLDVFHDVWRRASSYDAANGTVLGWIMNQARSRAIDRLRFDTRLKRVEPQGAQPQEIAEEPDPRELLELKQQGAALRAALTVLSSDEREAIELAFFRGLTHAEVATRLNLPLGTVKTRIRAGLQKARRAMRAEERQA